ncbi:MAG: acriflavine resistance protein B, partial [Verrucomicrobia bacterium]|nr:acriflavine resistance protein B [Verrucomicrobiota bacterium]
MNFSEPFIRRPVATALLTVGMVLLGVLGYAFLPVSALPAIDFPTVEVRTGYPGASPEVMAAAVTTPLERQFGQISGLQAMTSVSAFGYSSITLQFGLDRDIDAASQDVQAAINVAAGVLPRNLPSPPVFSKVNPADPPILTLVVSSETLPLQQVNDFADTVLAQKLSQISGVGLVTIQGSQKPAVRIRLNPAALASAGLSLEDVRNAILASNVNAPKGGFDGGRQSMVIQTNDQISSAAGFRPMVIAYRNGAPVRLSDVGDIIDNVENNRQGAWVGANPVVVVDILRQPGANIIATAERIKALLPQLRSTIPAAV